MADGRRRIFHRAPASNRAVAYNDGPIPNEGNLQRHKRALCAVKRQEKAGGATMRAERPKVLGIQRGNSIFDQHEKVVPAPLKIAACEHRKSDRLKNEDAGGVPGRSSQRGDGDDRR